MRYARHFRAVFAFVAVVTLITPLGSPLSEASADARPKTGRAVHYALSRPARELPPSAVGSAPAFIAPRINPLANEPDGDNAGPGTVPVFPSIR
jgi:hypothetical protein